MSFPRPGTQATARAALAVAVLGAVGAGAATARGDAEPVDSGRDQVVVARDQGSAAQDRTGNLSARPAATPLAPTGASSPSPSPSPTALPSGPAPVAPTGIGDVDRLEPVFRDAVRRAIAAAVAEGVTLVVTSGYRSRSHQQEIFDAGIAKYGSAEAARAWVLPPDESAHVRGRAIDVGPEAAALWLEQNGLAFGLCRRYDNEPWHFELLAPAVGSACPPRQASAAG